MSDAIDSGVNVAFGALVGVLVRAGTTREELTKMLDACFNATRLAPDDPRPAEAVRLLGQWAEDLL